MGKNCANWKRYLQLIAGMAAFAVMICDAGPVRAAVVITSCTDCHGMPSRDAARKANPHFRSQSSAFIGNHKNHLPAVPVAGDCNTCHPQVSTTNFGHQNNIIAMANSLKGYSSVNIRAKYDKGVFVNQTSIPNLINASCSNVSCHFETKTPVWGSTAPIACNTCHGSPPAGTPGTPSGGLAGSHARHEAYFPGTTNCQKCHPGHTSFAHATSVGRPLRVQGYLRNPLNTLESGATYSGSGSNYLPSQSSSQIFGSCSNLYCHGTSMPGGDTSGSNRTPVWNSTSYLPATLTAAACATCHGFPPLAASGHPGGITIPAGFPATPIGATCSCHSNINTSSATASSYANIFVSRSLHINGFYESAAGGHIFPYGGSLHLSVAGTTPWAGCTGCHTNAAGGAYPVTAGTAPNCTGCHLKGLQTPSGISSCWDCHGPSATNGQPNGNVFPNISGSHSKHVVGQGMACSACHSNGGSGSANHGSRNRVASNSTFVNLTSTTAQFHFTRTGKGTCSNVACHGTAEWGVTKFNCLTCHSVAIGARAAVTGQFAAQSHHVQNAELPLTTAHCAKCHWEAKADGSVDSFYHSGTSGKGVSLVVWNGTSRPVTATIGTTYISYTANGSRAQIAKLNRVCLGCHNSAGITATAMFGIYASDQFSPEPKMVPALAKTSILSRYSSTRTVAWSNYTFTNSSGQVTQYGTNRKNLITKALSAHGNATKNQFPNWANTANGSGEDETMADIAPATLGSNRNVLCYDCHNSHGSDAAGITSSYSSATGRYKGGLLKSTIAGQGGYAVTYKPAARTIRYRSYSSTTLSTSALFNAGASICNDCHNNDTRKINISRPWSITGTYSSTRAIVGYWSTPYFDNYTVASAIRTAYKAGGTPGTIKDLRKPMGGHYGSSINGSPAGHSGEINGLCTPCHDPHGVSSAMTAVNRGKSVPLLKGTWVTSPYREDRATPVVKRGGGSNFTGFAAMGAMPGYNIDQNTLIALPAPLNRGASTVTSKSNKRAQAFTVFPGAAGSALAKHTEKTPADFAGLCIGCHAQATLTNTSAPAAGNWMSKERVHQSVAGWAATTGTNANGTVHAYTCSKCHVPHVSRLPRLMITNCLDVRHVKRSVAGGSIATAPAANPGFAFGNVLQSYASSAYGAGRFPGGGSRYSSAPGSAQNNGPWYFQTVQPAAATYGSNCHNATNAGGTAYNPAKQIWNKKTRW